MQVVHSYIHMLYTYAYVYTCIYVLYICECAYICICTYITQAEKWAISYIIVIILLDNNIVHFIIYTYVYT